MDRIWNGEARVVGQEAYTPSCFKMTLAVRHAPAVAAGQFCHILTEEATDPLLRRPFSYWDVRPGKDGETHVDLLYTVVGKGTSILAGKKPGARVGYLGPLGVGFSPEPTETFIFVAGGVGIVPFYLFARQLRDADRTPRMVLLFGGRTQEMLYGIDDFPAVGVEALAATEDGSRGLKGRVTDLLEAQLGKLDRKGLRLFTCGPDPMNEAVVRIARREGLACEVSMERRMGCALGACGACVTRVHDAEAEDGWRHSRICWEGPCYDAARLVIE